MPGKSLSARSRPRLRACAVMAGIGTLQADDPWRLNPRRSQFTQTGGDFNVNYTGTGNIANGRQFIIGSGAERGIYLATAGNLIGGSLLVGAVYWFVYLRRRTGQS